MKLSFKAFLAEMAVQQQVAYVAKNLIGAKDIERVMHIDDSDLTHAKEVAHATVDSAAGRWIIHAFKEAGKFFLRVEPPKGEGTASMYFIPKREEA